MATYTKAVRTQVVRHPNWGTVKEWAKSKLKKESLVEATLFAATLSVIGMVLFSLHRAMENCILLGF